MPTFKEFIAAHPEIKLTGNAPRPFLSPDDVKQYLASRTPAPVEYHLALTVKNESFDFAYSMGCGLLEKHVGRGKFIPAQLPTYKKWTLADVDAFAKVTRPRSPTLEDVLLSLALDAGALVNCSCFEDWADDYGYDLDSRAAEQVYKTCIAQSRELRSVLGYALFDELMTCEED